MIDHIILAIYKSLSIVLNRHLSSIGYSVYKGRHRYVYRIRGKKNDHFLTLQVFKDHYEIKGSIRKWYLGADSFDDLTHTQIVEVIIELAKILKVPQRDIATAIIKKIEFGRTFTLHGTTCSNLIDKVLSFSTFDDPRRYKTSVTFKGQDYQFELYGKSEEIAKAQTQSNNLLRDNKLRIELRLIDRKGIAEKLEGINTIQDFLMYYKFITMRLLAAIMKVRFKPSQDGFNSDNFDGKTITDLRKYLTYKGMCSIGASTTFQLLKNLNSANHSKYKAEFTKLLAEGEKLDKYGRLDFLNEIKQEVLKILRDPMLKYQLL